MNYKNTLLINYEGAFGGAENMLTNFSKILAENSSEVSFFIRSGSQFKHYLDGVDNHMFNIKVYRPCFGYASFVFSLILELRKSRYDLLVLNNQRAIVIAPLIRLFFKKIKIIAYEHTMQPTKVRNYILDTIIDCSIDKYVCVSKFMYNQRKSSNKCIQIYNGIEDSYCASHKKNSLITFGVTSIFRRWKGQDNVIRAFSELINKGVLCKLIFIGGRDDSDKEYFDECQNLALSLKMEEHIKFMGFVSNPLPFISRNIDILIQSSVKPDPLPTTVVEALMLAKPIIGYDFGGIREMIINNYNGKLLDKPSVSSLEAAMKELVNDKERLIFYSLNSRKLFVNKFSFKQYKSDMSDLLKSEI